MSSSLERIWYPPAGESRAQRWLCAPLSLLSAAYGAGAAVQRWRYRTGRLPTVLTRKAPVVSVGNLTVGGSGKTPCVMALTERLLARGIRVAVLSRGYGREDREDRVLSGGASDADWRQVGDEPLLIARRCPKAVVLVGRDRGRLALVAEERYGAEVILLDDGMQHRRLERDLEVVVIDARVGFGNGRLLPRGPLREPLSLLPSADLFWIRDGDDAATGMVEDPLAIGGVRLPTRPRVHVRDVVSGLRVGPHREAPSRLQGTRVWAFSGIARPERFRRTLVEQGAEVVEHTAFPDHHPFREAELETLRSRAAAAGVPLITTEKDAVRLPSGFGVWVLEMSLGFMAGEATLDAVLDRMLREATEPGDL